MIRFYDQLFDDELVEIEEQDLRYMMWTEEGIAIVNTDGLLYLASVVYVKENMERKED